MIDNDSKHYQENCQCDIKEWAIYDAKGKQLYNLTNDEFKNFLLDRPVNLLGRFIYIRGEKTWIDGMLNTDWWK